ncbi:Nesprin-1 [Sparganum proliferum]
MLRRKYNLDIKDFGPSWRDGVAFNAIVHSINPNLVDMQEVANCSNRENLHRAFSLAEEELGIPKLLDPEDVDVDKPDEKSIMTYVAQFYKAYPEAGKPKTLVSIHTYFGVCLKFAP